jgi:hypothetical protein
MNKKGGGKKFSPLFYCRGMRAVENIFVLGLPFDSAQGDSFLLLCLD